MGGISVGTREEGPNEQGATAVSAVRTVLNVDVQERVIIISFAQPFSATGAEAEAEESVAARMLQSLAAKAEGNTPVIVDLSGLEEMTTRFLAKIVSFNRVMKMKKRPLIFCNLSPKIELDFGRYPLGLFTVAADREEALQSLNRANT